MNVILNEFKPILEFPADLTQQATLSSGSWRMGMSRAHGCPGHLISHGYMHRSESRLAIATPKKVAISTRGRDKPIHGSCEIYLPGGAYRYQWRYTV